MAFHCWEDLQELQFLLSQAKRPLVQKLLSDEISSLQKALDTQNQEHMEIDGETAPSLPKPLSLEKAKVTPQVTYSALPNFAWDQDNDRVKIYIPIEGAAPEKVETDVQKNSFDIKIHDVNGKNYRFGVPKLSKNINPDESRVIVKPKRITVSLKKKDWGNWLDLNYKDSKLKPKKDDDNKDPMAGIMDLMKNMYEEGDDNMKQTIAKAWTDARAGKKSDPTADF